MIKSITKKTNNKKGFTLIELIVVIAILGILAAIAVPRFTNVQKNARIDSDIAAANNVVSAAKVLIASKNMTNAEAIAANAVTVTTLESAGLLDGTPTAQTNKVDMVLSVTEVSDQLVFTVTATDIILPTAAGVFVKP